MDATALLAGDTPFDDVVRHVAKALADLTVNARVIVGCSGGRDSVGLLHLVAKARADLALTVIYVDHGLNDTTNDRAVVQRHCAMLGVAFVVREVTVDGGGYGLEAAARDARYDVFDASVVDLSAVCVLIAHTADDLAETVWMRLLRGTGPDGLFAMRHQDGRLWRPLLSVRRETVHRFVVEQGFDTVEDPMNSDRRFLRAQIRHDVFPVLAQVANDPVGAAWRLAMLAGDDQTLLRTLIDDPVGFHAFGDVAVTVPLDVFDALDVALQRRVVRRMLHQLRPSAGRTSRHSAFADVQRVVEASTPSRFTLAGELAVTRDDNVLCVARVAAEQDLPVVDGTDYPVALFGGRLTQQRVDNTRFIPPPYGDPGRFKVALKLSGQVTLRGLKDGDTVFTRGRDLAVKTLFQAAKVPVALRHHWPVLVADETVMWVPGFAANDVALVSSDTPQARIFTFLEVGNCD